MGCLAYSIAPREASILANRRSPAFAGDSLVVLNIDKAFNWYRDIYDGTDCDIEGRGVDYDGICIDDFVVLRAFSFGSIVAQTDKEVPGSRADFGCIQDALRTEYNTGVNCKGRVVPRH